MRDSPGTKIAASALTFATTHAALRHGPVHRRLERMYVRRRDAGLIQPTAKPEKLAAQAGSRILNEIHNIMVVPMAIAAMFDSRLNQDRVRGVTPLCSVLTLLSAGYFCTETAIILRNYNEHGFEPLAHAIVCIAFFVMVSFNKKMQWFVPRVLFFECSTPLVHARWLLASMGLSNTKLYKINGIAMMGAFFVCRVLWGTKLIWSFITRAHLYTKVGFGLGPGMFRVICVAAAGITSLNYYWFYKMVRGAFRVLGRKRRPNSSAATSREPSQHQNTDPADQAYPTPSQNGSANRSASGNHTGAMNGGIDGDLSHEGIHEASNTHTKVVDVPGTINSSQI